MSTPSAPTYSNTIYTLPSGENEESSMKYESFQQNGEGNTTPASRQQRRPSLPWFVEYWSSTFFQTPMIMENLCACKSTAVVFEEDKPYKPDHDFRFDIPNEHSWRLRKMVASHDESMLMGDETTLLAGNKGNGIDGRDSIYPTKTLSSPYYYPSIRKSSILYEEDDTEVDNDDVKQEQPQEEANKSPSAVMNGSDSLLDNDDDDSIVDDDEPRDQAPASTTTDAVNRDYSTTLLYSCNSFDCMSMDDDHHQPSHIRPRRMVTTPPRRTTRQRLQHPPSPSAQTYTTVSLSNSFMKEFESDGEDEEQDNDSLIMSSSTIEYLKQWTEASSSLFRPKTEGDMFSTPKSSPKNVLSSPPTSSSPPPQFDPSETSYRHLIRMRPQNYIHDLSLSSSSVEEEKKEEHPNDYNNHDASSFNYVLPSHEQLKSDMSFHEAFFATTTTNTNPSTATLQ